MWLKITTCEQRQTKQVTRIQIAGIMRKKILIFPGQKGFIVSLPKNTTQKKHPLRPPFGHSHFHVSHSFQKKSRLPPRSASSFIPVMALAPQQDEARQKTWLPLMVFWYQPEKLRTKKKVFRTKMKKKEHAKAEHPCIFWSVHFFFAVCLFLIFGDVMVHKLEKLWWVILLLFPSHKSVVETIFIRFRNGWNPG